MEIRSGGVSFVSPRGVTISDLAIGLPGTAPFLTIEKTFVRIDFVALMTDRPSIGLVELSGLDFILRRDSEGAWEVSRIRSKSAGGSGGGGKLQWPLDLRVNEAAIMVALPSDSAVKTFDEIEASVDLPRREATMRISNPDERLLLSIKRDSLDWTAESVSLALAAPFTGRVLDMAKASLTAAGRVRGSALAASGVLNDITIDHRLLARDAADGISFGFGLDLEVAGDTIDLRDGYLSLGGESIALRATVKGRTRPVIDFRAGFSAVDVGRLVAAIPRSLVPHLPDLAATGTINGEFRFFIDMNRPRTLDYAFDGGVDSFSITRLGPDIDIEGKRDSFLHAVRKPDGTIHHFIVGPENPDFVPLDEIPRTVPSAVMTAEDGSFYSHKGFSIRHIRDSIIENLEAGRVVRGASTITMQLAKNLFLTRDRTLTRKIEEAFITMALEERLEKKRMMEIYLNIIEWGPGIYGIGPAAKCHFNKPARDLGAIESARLASIIARPSRPPVLGALVRDILTKMFHRGDVDTGTLVAAGVSDTIIKSLVEKDTEEPEVAQEIEPASR